MKTRIGGLWSDSMSSNLQLDDTIIQAEKKNPEKKKKNKLIDYFNL
jgi:hypothetical protein